MPSGTLPAANSLGDPDIATGDYQTQINQLLAYVRDLQSELAALSGTEIKEGAVRAVGGATGNVPDTAQLNTRLGTTGNLGDAAQRTVGYSSLNLVESSRISRVAFDASFGVAANGSGSFSIPAHNSEKDFHVFSIKCVSDSSISVSYGDRSPPAGDAGAYIQYSFGSARLIIVNETAATQQFNVAIFKIKALA